MAEWPYHSPRMLRLAEAVKEERQVVMKVELLNVDLPVDRVALCILRKRRRKKEDIIALVNHLF